MGNNVIRGGMKKKRGRLYGLQSLDDGGKRRLALPLSLMEMMDEESKATEARGCVTLLVPGG